MEYNNVIDVLEAIINNIVPKKVGMVYLSERDPVIWAYENLGVTLYSNQVEIVKNMLDLKIDNLALLQARGGGKSFAVVIGLLKLCLDHKNFKVGIFAPKAEQATRLIKDEFYKIVNKDTKIYNEIDWKDSTKSRFSFKNGSEILAISAAPTTQQEGYHFFCLTKGTEIHTKDGIQKIEDIIDKDNIFVWSYNEKTASLELKPILISFEKSNTNSLYEIETEDGKKLIITEDHKVFTQRGWIEAKDLIENDVLLEIVK